MSKVSTYFPLDSKVLAVAIIGDFKDWSAYIGAVPGINHDKEKFEVARTGNKLPFEIAQMLFPEHARTLKWRE